MLATILKSLIATQTTLAIINTFAEVRELKITLFEMRDSDSVELNIPRPEEFKRNQNK